MARKLTCALLCEDREHEMLFRPILEKIFGAHRVRLEPRKSTGGVTFVLQQVDKVNRDLRRFPGEARGALIVVDGDESGLKGRLAEIGQSARDELDERIAICVPSRTVETWELWLCGRRDLDETTQYKDEFRHQVAKGSMSPRQAAKAWHAALSSKEQELEAATVPALVAGREQIARLSKFAKS